MYDLCSEVQLYKTTYSIKELFISKLEEGKTCFFFGDITSAGFVEMVQLFRSVLLECHIFTAGVIMQHISLK